MQRNSDGLTRIKLKVQKSLMCLGNKQDFHVGVFGSVPQLGMGCPERAARCTPSISGRFWTKDIWVPKRSEVTFKFVVFKSLNNDVVDSESIPARVLMTGDQQKLVETRYNCTNMTEQEVSLESLSLTRLDEHQHICEVIDAAKDTGSHAGKDTGLLVVPELSPVEFVPPNSEHIPQFNESHAAITDAAKGTMKPCGVNINGCTADNIEDTSENKMVYENTIKIGIQEAEHLDKVQAEETIYNIKINESQDGNATIVHASQAGNTTQVQASQAGNTTKVHASQAWNTENVHTSQAGITEKDHTSQAGNTEHAHASQAGNTTNVHASQAGNATIVDASQAGKTTEFHMNTTEFHALQAGNTTKVHASQAVIATKSHESQAGNTTKVRINSALGFSYPVLLVKNLVGLVYTIFKVFFCRQ